MKALLLQLDGKLPNLALMRLSAHHKTLGNEVVLWNARTTDDVDQALFLEQPDHVCASLIFTKTAPLAEHLMRVHPDAQIGGTGWDIAHTVERAIGRNVSKLDYSIYPYFKQSIGFTQRGCRLSCSFCVVPLKEGKVREEQTIADLWRGDPHPRELLLLDNDFFGQEHWRRRIVEIREGGFKVSFNQGINARMLSDEAAEAIGSVKYYDDGMTARRIYTAWDSRPDEATLFRGLNALTRHGVKPDHIMVYMLIGYWPNETEEDWLYRQSKIREFGARPYPMPFNRTTETIGFQRWVVRRYDLNVPWQKFKANHYRPEGL